MEPYMTQEMDIKNTDPGKLEDRESSGDTYEKDNDGCHRLRRSESAARGAGQKEERERFADDGMNKMTAERGPSLSTSTETTQPGRSSGVGESCDQAVSPADPQNKLDLSAALRFRDLDVRLDLARDINPDLDIEKCRKLLLDSASSAGSVDSVDSSSNSECLRARCRHLKKIVVRQRSQLGALRSEFQCVCRGTEQNQLEHFKLEALLRKTIAEEEQKIAALRTEARNKDRLIEEEKSRSTELLRIVQDEQQRNHRLEKAIEQCGLQMAASFVAAHDPVVQDDVSAPFSSSSLSGTMDPEGFHSSENFGSYSRSRDVHYRRKSPQAYPSSPTRCQNEMLSLGSGVFSSGFRNKLCALPPDTASRIVKGISRVLERLLVDVARDPHSSADEPYSSPSSLPSSRQPREPVYEENPGILSQATSVGHSSVTNKRCSLAYLARDDKGRPGSSYGQQYLQRESARSRSVVEDRQVCKPRKQRNTEVIDELRHDSPSRLRPACMTPLEMDPIEATLDYTSEKQPVHFPRSRCLDPETMREDCPVSIKPGRHRIPPLLQKCDIYETYFPRASRRATVYPNAGKSESSCGTQWHRNQSRDRTSSVKESDHKNASRLIRAFEQKLQSMDDALDRVAHRRTHLQHTELPTSVEDTALLRRRVRAELLETEDRVRALRQYHQKTLHDLDVFGGIPDTKAESRFPDASCFQDGIFPTSDKLLEKPTTVTEVHGNGRHRSSTDVVDGVRLAMSQVEEESAPHLGGLKGSHQHRNANAAVRRCASSFTRGDNATVLLPLYSSEEWSSISSKHTKKVDRHNDVEKYQCDQRLSEKPATAYKDHIEKRTRRDSDAVFLHQIKEESVDVSVSRTSSLRQPPDAQHKQKGGCQRGLPDLRHHCGTKTPVNPHSPRRSASSKERYPDSSHQRYLAGESRLLQFSRSSEYPRQSQLNVDNSGLPNCSVYENGCMEVERTERSCHIADHGVKRSAGKRSDEVQDSCSSSCLVSSSKDRVKPTHRETFKNRSTGQSTGNKPAVPLQSIRCTKDVLSLQPVALDSLDASQTSNGYQLRLRRPAFYSTSQHSTEGGSSTSHPVSRRRCRNSGVSSVRA